MYSGGKDSAYAIEYCKSRNWNIKYLVSVKPTRTDCYLFHYATVELTQELSKILGYKHFLLSCNVADPQKEANIVKELIEEEQKTNRIDALVLGGVGLQVTQLKSLQNAMLPLNVEVFASHAGADQRETMIEMINKGYKFMITQIASDGLDSWLGKTLTKLNIETFFKDSEKYGFNVIGEGGYYDSLAFAGPIFGDKELVIKETEKVMEDKYSGHIDVKKFEIINLVQNVYKFQSS